MESRIPQDHRQRTTHQRPRLRVGLLLDDTRLYEWQYRMLARIIDDDCADLVLAVTRAPVSGQATAQNSGRSVPLMQRVGYRLYQLFRRLDSSRLPAGPDPFAIRELQDLPVVIPVVAATPVCRGRTDRLDQSDLDEIESFDVDLFIRLGWRILQGGILSLPRYGVWSYHHGDNRVNRGGPPCIWEYANDEATTGLTLQRLTPDLDDGQVLARSSVATDPVSPARTRELLYWRSISVLPNTLKRLVHQGAARFFSDIEQRNSRPVAYSKRLYSPSRLDVRMSLKLIGKWAWRYAAGVLSTRLFDDQWVLFYRLADGLPSSMWQYQRLVPPPDRYWADPHILERDGVYHVFVEEYLYKECRGRIAVIPVAKDGSVGEPRVALETAEHMSYPFVFEYQNEIYMIPETGARRQIELYRCVGFPDQWRLVRVLMSDVHAVDTTLHFDGGRCWMFTSIRDYPGHHTSDELRLFSTDDLLTGEWQSHPQGVVVSDVRSARPAGPVFRYKDAWYRPSQDGSRGYGYAVSLNLIQALTTEHYVEKPVTRILPQWADDIRGVHTFCHVPGITVLDARTRVMKLPRLWRATGTDRRASAPVLAGRQQPARWAADSPG